MDGDRDPRNPRLLPVRDGPWTGWLYDPGDSFEVAVGPFYARYGPGEEVLCAFRCEAKHLNGGGFLHGGCLMTFADYSLFCIARQALDGSAGVTTTFSGEFVGSVYEGALVECTGEVVKAGRSLVFFRGLITSAGEPVMSFSSVIKKVSRGGRGPNA